MQRFFSFSDYLVYRHCASAGFQCARLHTVDLPALSCWTLLMPPSVFTIAFDWFCWLQQTASSESDLVTYAVLLAQSDLSKMSHSKVTGADGDDHSPTNGVKYQLQCTNYAHIRLYLFIWRHLHRLHIHRKTKGLAGIPRNVRCHAAVKDVALQKQQVASSCLRAQTLHLLHRAPRTVLI